MNTLKYITFSILVGLPFFSLGQNARLKYADKMYEAKAYYDASEAYEDVLERKVDSATVALRIADSYDKIGNAVKAVEWYRYLKRENEISQENLLKLAFLERTVENYEESDHLFDAYANLYGDSDLPYGVLNEDLTMEKLKENKGAFQLIKQGVNTAKSEIGVSYFGANEVLISSSQRRVKAAQQVNSWTGDYFYDIYKAPVDANGVIGKMKLMKSDAKTKYHDGPAFYCATNQHVYFTRSNVVDGQKIADNENVVLLKIFKAKVNSNDFEDAKPLSIINGNDFSTAHPFVSEDGKQLFFASNRPGGFGGMDIYVIDLDQNGNPTGEPRNLGNKINTPQNEIFPSYNSEENIVFFSSNGHYGLGGLDIYAGLMNKSGEVAAIQNLGAPINSPADDFSYVSNATQTKGFFSSSRNGSVGLDDVYGFKQEEPIQNVFNTQYLIAGTIKNSVTNENLANTSIVLVDNKTDERFAQVQTNEDGSFETEFLPYFYDDAISYSIKVEKEGYISDVFTFTKQLAEEEVLHVNYSLVEIEVDKTDLGEIVELQPIHFDLNSSYLREDAKTELNKIVKVLENNPNMHIDLRAHTDTRGEYDYNQWLSDRRAKRSAEYIIESGIDQSRITYRGFGQNQLKVSDQEIENVNSEEEKERLHQINRRTEFIVVK